MTVTTYARPKGSTSAGTRSVSVAQASIAMAEPPTASYGSSLEGEDEG